MKSALDQKPLKIAIDCRFWGLENTGLGRYTMRLVNELAQLDKHHHYFLLFRQSAYYNYTRIAAKFHGVLAEAPHYSLKEQLRFPSIINSIKPDVLHVPHFNIPVLWRGKLVVTIHDLIKNQSVGRNSTTLPVYKYWLKRLVYKQVVNHAISESQAILVPSQFTKQEILENYAVSPNKITVTYEAPDAVYFEKQPITYTNKSSVLKKYGLTIPYLIYTGNVYPHKNLELLVKAVQELKHTQLQLAVVCARNVFQGRLQEIAAKHHIYSRVKFLDSVPDADLRQLYRYSEAFVTPSLLEGFGLSGLEAMAAGTPVLAAYASCLPEVYGDAAIYFNPHNHHDVVDKINEVLQFNMTQRSNHVNVGIAHAQTFSWKRMAEQTLEVYQAVASWD
jgi:glycosyltransferase involved in cell wall biosynthesis